MMRVYNLMLVSMLPFIYGCLGGGGSGSSGSSAGLVGGSESLGGGAGVGVGSGIVGGVTPGNGLEGIHNPEPATMLLVGGGIAAMAYYRNLKK